MNTMVAVLTTDPIYALPRHPDDVPEVPIARRSRPRHLHAVSQLQAVPAPRHTPRAVSPGADAGSQSAQARTAGPLLSTTEIATIVAVVVLAVAFVASFGSLQAPAQSTWAELNPQSVPAAAAGVDETVVLVKAGDTLWGIAGSIAPGADRREAVQILAERNGGAAIWAGQDLVIPASLANP
jgi:nucleoid-associated protein YgaU